MNIAFPYLLVLPSLQTFVNLISKIIYTIFNVLHNSVNNKWMRSEIPLLCRCVLLV